LQAAQRMISSDWLRYPLLVLSLLFCLLALSPLLAGIFRPKAKLRYTKAVSKTPFAFMFPSVRSERLTFGALSISAGLWEEVIFRSFFIYFFSSAPFNFNPFVALVVSSILFGVNHGYQGMAGIVRTGVVGLMFGLLYFTTGSLILAMTVHALVDLSAVFMFRPDLLETEKEHQTINGQTVNAF